MQADRWKGMHTKFCSITMLENGNLKDRYEDGTSLYGVWARALLGWDFNSISYVVVFYQHCLNMGLHY